MFHDEAKCKRLVLAFQKSIGLQILILSFLIARPALASNLLSDEPAIPTDGKQVYYQYFTIDDTSSPQMSSDFTDPLQIFSNTLNDSIQAAGKTNLDLLKWVMHKGEIGNTPEKYNRKKHFGTWINDKTDNSCLNTRHKVLEQDSETPVQYKPTNNCVVDSGEWYDPYSGKVFTRASDLDVDHMVPLKNVYVNAAYKWNDKKRCLYANFLANNFHLIPVSSSENRIKGDKSPADYMPPNESYACEYLENWLKVKLIWSIPMQPPEKDAIATLIKEYGCDPGIMKISKSALKKQRTLTNELQKICE